MTDDDAVKRAAIMAALGAVACPSYAMAAAIEATLPFVSVVDGLVVVTGGIRSAGTEWVPVTGTEPRFAHDMSGQGRRDLPLPIVELIRELCRCERGGIRWKPHHAPLY